MHLSNAKQKTWYAKARVAGRALEYWNHYESLHFRCHWSQITWERMKEDLCIEYFPQYFHKDLQQPSHGNLQDLRTSMRQCKNAKLTHEVYAIRQDLGNLIKMVEALATQMKGNQVPSDLDIDKEVQVSTKVSKFMQPEESTIEPKQQEASMLEESSTVNEDPKLDEVKIVDMPIPLIEFVIPETFHEVEYEVYLFSMLPKLIPQL